jgi:hypothetical protein
MKKHLMIGFVFFSLNASACLHYPNDYAGTVTEHKKEFFLFGGKESFHIIAKTNLSSSGKLPERLAWVFPLPSVPVKYEEVSPTIFKELYQLTSPATDDLRGIPKSEGLNSVSGIKVHDAQTVGRYKVRPLEILDANPTTASALDVWLQSNNLKMMPKEKQLRYLVKGAVFLVIEADLKGLSAVDFKPLHIVLKAMTHYSLPLNFTHVGRAFAVDVYTMNLKLSKDDRSLDFSSSTNFSFPDPNYPNISKLFPNGTGHFYKYEGKFLGTSSDSRDPLFNVE